MSDTNDPENLVQGYPNPRGGYGLFVNLVTDMLSFSPGYLLCPLVVVEKNRVFESYVCFSEVFDPPGLSSESFGSVMVMKKCKVC